MRLFIKDSSSTATHGLRVVIICLKCGEVPETEESGAAFSVRGNDVYRSVWVMSRGVVICTAELNAKDLLNISKHQELRFNKILLEFVDKLNTLSLKASNVSAKDEWAVLFWNTVWYKGEEKSPSSPLSPGKKKKLIWKHYKWIF